MENTASSRQGTIVTAASTGIGLVLGILYAWSVIRGGIPDSWGWTNADKALPYSVACMVFALTMVPAGRLQDRVGPRWAVLVGGILTGLGCVIAALGGSSLAVFVAGFGVVTGIGIGFGYAAITPAAIKWFPPEKTGIITGIVVAGFGMASIFIAPLTTWLLNLFATTRADGVVEKGISNTLMVIGIGTVVVVVLLSGFIRNPESPVASPAKGPAKSNVDVPASVMLRTSQFYLLWVMYFCGSAAGLMFISVAQDLGKKSLGTWAFMAVVTLAVGNAGGRILAGFLSDRIGRQKTMLAEFLGQAVVVSALYLVTRGGNESTAVILIIIALLGMNYGSNLALFPAACKDWFGLRGFGLNYGWLFTAWGAAGLVMPWINGMIRDMTGSSDISYAMVVAMMLLAAALSVDSARLPRPDFSVSADAKPTSAGANPAPLS